MVAQQTYIGICITSKFFFQDVAFSLVIFFLKKICNKIMYITCIVFNFPLSADWGHVSHFPVLCSFFFFLLIYQFCFVWREGSVSMTINQGIVISKRLKLSIRDIRLSNCSTVLITSLKIFRSNGGVCVGLFRCQVFQYTKMFWIMYQIWRCGILVILIY